MSAARAWTARALADALSAPQDVAERALEDAVTAGECVRVASAGSVFYVAGPLRDVLETLGALPVDATDVEVLRRQHGVAPTSTRASTAMIRKRVRRLLDELQP